MKLKTGTIVSILFPPVLSAANIPDHAVVVPSAYSLGHVHEIPTQYPTTLTQILPTTTTSYVTPNPAFPMFTGSIAYITTMTVTLLEPWPASPTSFPYTLTQTAISDMTITTTLPSQPPTSYVNTYHYTNEETMVMDGPGVTS